MTNEHTSLEKYISHTLFERVAKGLCVRGELETEQTATYWPQVPLTIAALLSYSAGLFNRGSWGPKPSAGSWFSLPWTATWTPTNWLQLWHWVISLFDVHLLPVGIAIALVISWYLQPHAPVSRLTAGSKVNMLQRNTSPTRCRLGSLINQAPIKWFDRMTNNIWYMERILLPQM